MHVYRSIYLQYTVIHTKVFIKFVDRFPHKYTFLDNFIGL